jgi:hypothetical protein
VRTNKTQIHGKQRVPTRQSISVAPCVCLLRQRTGHLAVRVIISTRAIPVLTPRPTQRLLADNFLYTDSCPCRKQFALSARGKNWLAAHRKCTCSENTLTPCDTHRALPKAQRSWATCLIISYTYGRMKAELLSVCKIHFASQEVASLPQRLRICSFQLALSKLLTLHRPRL